MQAYRPRPLNRSCPWPTWRQAPPQGRRLRPHIGRKPSTELADEASFQAERAARCLFGLTATAPINHTEKDIHKVTSQMKVSGAWRTLEARRWLTVRSYRSTACKHGRNSMTSCPTSSPETRAVTWSRGAHNHEITFKVNPQNNTTLIFPYRKRRVAAVTKIKEYRTRTHTFPAMPNPLPDLLRIPLE